MSTVRLVLMLLLLADLLAIVRPARVLLGLVLVLSVWWILVNAPVEGPVLLPLTWHHGVTVADLLSIGSWLEVGLLLLLRSPRT